jgi:hypothetical protein
MRMSGKRVAMATMGLAAAIAYVWIGAVRAVPAVRRRKELARSRRGEGSPPG